MPVGPAIALTFTGVRGAGVLLSGVRSFCAPQPHSATSSSTAATAKAKMFLFFIVRPSFHSSAKAEPSIRNVCRSRRTIRPSSISASSER